MTKHAHHSVSVTKVGLCVTQLTWHGHMLKTNTNTDFGHTTIRFSHLCVSHEQKKKSNKQTKTYLIFSAPIPIRRTEKAASPRHRPHHLTSKQLVSQVLMLLSVSPAQLGISFLKGFTCLSLPAKARLMLINCAKHFIYSSLPFPHPSQPPDPLWLVSN